MTTIFYLSLILHLLPFLKKKRNVVVPESIMISDIYLPSNLLTDLAIFRSLYFFKKHTKGSAIKYDTYMTLRHI